MKLKNTKLRQGDEVIVVSGREKGKRGNIKKIVGDKCIVNDLNLAKKHTRPNPQLGITGGIVEKEMPINLSNVMIWNSATKKKDKIAILSFFFVALFHIITFERLIGISFSTIPPVMPSCGLGLVCFFARLRSFTMHLSPTIFLILPLLPFSLPETTMTSSPCLNFVFFNFI